MSSVAPPASDPAIVDVVGHEAARLEDFLDRDVLAELLKSVHKLFGIGVRVYSAEGALVGAEASDLPLCAFVNELPGGRQACGATVSAARSVDPGATGDVVHACFTGLAYRIVSIDHEGRRVGRIVLGPYVPSGLTEPSPELARTEPRLDGKRALELLGREPRVKTEALSRIAAHVKTTLELVVFSSHKAYVTSKLHLHSVRESYRELEDKTRRLELALTRLRDLDRLKSNFLATVSHELRTPLTSIIGYSEMLGEGLAGPLSDEQADFVRTIHAKSGQLLALISGLLDLTKMESGTMTLRQGTVRVAPVLADVITTLAPVARKKGVELTLTHDDLACDLTGDVERLRQVFTNLVDNAVKFTPAGGKVVVTGRVLQEETREEDGPAVLLAPLAKSVEVRVADSGIGIAPRERERVFDAFYQVDSSSTREYGGTGLGLSIVKRIVEAHGGTVRIESNEPNGSVFVVTLPSAHVRLPRSVPPPSSST